MSRSSLSVGGRLLPFAFTVEVPEGTPYPLSFFSCELVFRGVCCGLPVVRKTDKVLGEYVNRFQWCKDISEFEDGSHSDPILSSAVSR